MQYPQRIIKLGEQDAAIVTAVVQQLRARGYSVAAGTAVFDASMKSIVKLFQAQNVDAAARPLIVDGEIGPMTWHALFGAAPVTVPPTGLAGSALAVALSQLGVMEDPIGTNSGKQVNAYLASTGLGGGHFWCMAFVYWCFREAAAGGPAGVVNPFPKTAGCLDAWNRVKKTWPLRLLPAAIAKSDPTRVRPGMVFILDYGNGYGHTGFVKQAIGGALRTVEGNTNALGSGNGVGVFELNRRKVTDDNLKGFIDFS